jgi:hypothetical protein
MLPTTCHVYFGSVIGATPDGRKAGVPLSEGISPVQGADRRGPTAVLRSVAKMDHARTGGTLLNQKFTPQLLQDESGLDKLVQLIRTYFRLDGHHVQFNVVDAATLRAAQANPEQYRDLISPRPCRTRSSPARSTSRSVRKRYCNNQQYLQQEPPTCHCPADAVSVNRNCQGAFHTSTVENADPRTTHWLKRPSSPQI